MIQIRNAIQNRLGDLEFVIWALKFFNSLIFFEVV
jgi:hypothetical protein